MAWQSQARSAELLDERVGFVWASRVRMAESRSERVDDAPCIGVPPERAIFVFGAGEPVREFGWELRRDVWRMLGRSERRGPAAEGGGLGEGLRELGAEVGMGS